MWLNFGIYKRQWRTERGNFIPIGYWHEHDIYGFHSKNRPYFLNVYKKLKSKSDETPGWRNGLEGYPNQKRTKRVLRGLCRCSVKMELAFEKRNTCCRMEITWKEMDDTKMAQNSLTYWFRGTVVGDLGICKNWSADTTRWKPDFSVP